MNKDDLIKKLENLNLPEVEIPSHQHRLKMALLNSGYFKEQTNMSILKKFAPVGAVAVVALLVMVGVNYFKVPPTVYAQELVGKAEDTLNKNKAIVGYVESTTDLIQWKEPDADGNVKDEKGRIIFVTQDGRLVPAPYELPDQNKYWAEKLEKMGGYPNAIFNDMAKAKNTAYYYIIVKPATLTQEQINTLRESGVRMLQLATQEEIDRAKKMGVGISDNKSAYFALIEADGAKIVNRLDFVVSIALPPQEKNSGGIDLTDETGNGKEVSYAVSKDDYLNFLEEAKKAPDLTYLGDKRRGDPLNPLSAVGRTIRVLQFTDEKGSTAILGIDESNYPVIRLAYTKDGDVVFGSGSIDGQTPLNFNLEEQIKYWTENLEQPIDLINIQK